MGKLWTPPDVTRELRDMTATHNRVLMEAMDFDQPGMVAVRRELEALDPGLRLGKARDRADLPGVRPGFWHIIKVTSTGPYTAWPLTDGHDRYAEPSLAMFDALRRADLQNPRVEQARKDAAARAEAEQAAAKDREDADRRTEIVERWKAASETSVSMSKDAPWTQNVDGRRGRKT